MIKKTLLFINLILISLNSFSQKCVDETDPFTNERKISFDYNYKTVYLQLIDEKIEFEITFSYRGERSNEFKENTELLFKLENGNILTLKTFRKSIPKIEQINYSSNTFGYGMGMSMSNSQNYSTYSFAFSLSKTELSQLAESKIDLIRIPDTDEGKFYDLESKGETKKKIKAINKGATCMNGFI
ncbi:hypothetical protein QLS71_012255 [Mariniflexile litorale]|uniref:Uncharacterized protein n=1 Tax=Mariniflexile litorale TaxID=3045158 RepID=A0AAU7ECE2_9FLAO|nr:hypothetical protein [Mariniflexile sp. KMM 9835]MDQ8213444.1 hypothetical protein [Mariniflexile sp. KMM 9835]